MRYQIDEKTTKMNYRYLCPQTIFGIFMQNYKMFIGTSQGAFHVVNREDLRREIELLLGVEAYSLRPWRGGATLFCFTRRKCRRDGVIYNYYK